MLFLRIVFKFTIEKADRKGFWASLYLAKS